MFSKAIVVSRNQTKRTRKYYNPKSEEAEAGEDAAGECSAVRQVSKDHTIGERAVCGARARSATGGDYVEGDGRGNRVGADERSGSRTSFLFAARQRGATASRVDRAMWGWGEVTT